MAHLHMRFDLTAADSSLIFFKIALFCDIKIFLIIEWWGQFL